MRLVGKSQLAKIAGVSPAAITKAIKAGRLTVNSAGKIDQDAADTVEYLSSALEKKRREHAAESSEPAPRAPGGGRKASPGAESDLAIERRLKIEGAKQVVLKRKLENAKTIGKVVLREDFERGIVGPIETTFVRLLTDLSKSMAGQIVPLVRGGATEEEIEIFLRDEHSNLLRNLKKQMKRALNENPRSN